MGGSPETPAQNSPARCAKIWHVIAIATPPNHRARDFAHPECPYLRIGTRIARLRPMSDTAPAPDWKPELDAIVGARHGGAAAALLPRLRALDTRYPHTPEILHQIAWTCEQLGRLREAAQDYERALSLGLPPNEMSAALLGLGSCLRCLGEYTRAEEVLREGRMHFPDQREFEVFLAMTLHNLGRHAEAIQTLIATLVETADDVGIAANQRTIRHQAAQIDRRWEQ
jgi:tetratricopeptide (TPR) repeat protein